MAQAVNATSNIANPEDFPSAANPPAMIRAETTGIGASI
jgi:hypothetical protein